MDHPPNPSRTTRAPRKPAAWLRTLRRAWVLWLRLMRRMATRTARRRSSLREHARRDDETALVVCPGDDLAFALWHWRLVSHWRTLACAARRTPLFFITLRSSLPPVRSERSPPTNSVDGTTMKKTPLEWAFFVKDLDRTEFRRNYRFRRDHVLPAFGADRSDGSQDPPTEAACREFARDAEDLIAHYRSASGRIKRQLAERLRQRLAQAGLLAA